MVTLTEYAKFCYVHIEHAKEDFNKYGYCIGFNNKKYSDFEQYKEDCRNQIVFEVENNLVEKDITFEEAYKIMLI